MTSASGRGRTRTTEAAPDRSQRRDGAEHHSRVLPLEPPEHLKKALRAGLLAQLGSDTLGVFELELFDWYVKETEAVLGQMSASEHAYIKEQIKAGRSDLNDSGIVAVEYYAKRLRYSHIIYLTSLLQTCLEQACSTLTTAVEKESLLVGLGDLKGDQWSKRCEFLERNGRFELPGDRWTEIEVLIWVRNNLVHENGSTTDLNDEHRAAFEKRPGLNVDGYELKIDEAFVRHAYEAVKAYVQAVEEKLREVIQRARVTGSTS